MRINLKTERALNVAVALLEDVGVGDLTAELISENTKASAQLITREDAVLCGIRWFNECFLQCDDDAQIQWFFTDGDVVTKNAVLCKITGNARALLTAERTALNFLQTLSAVATKTRHFVNLVKGTGAQIVDTRKTIPSLRSAQKYAVKCGGGKNHRMALWDAILIKENHIIAAGGIKQAFAAAQEIADANLQHCKFVQIEVENLTQLKEAIKAGAKMILLDNFSLEEMRKAVKISPDDVLLEASGNVSDATVLAIAQTGVHRISIGSLTKDIRAIDLSLRFL